MTNILASGKTGFDKYDIKQNDVEKVLTRLDVRTLAESLQYLLEATRGWSYTGNEGKDTARNNEVLAIINANNLSSFSSDFYKALNTMISFANFLDVDSLSTANSIILKQTKIVNVNAPDGVNYCKNNVLPFTFVDNLTFRFKAKNTNTGAVQIQISELAGLSGAVSLLNEAGQELTAGDIIENKYYTIMANSVTVGETTTKRFLLKSEVRESSNTSKGLTYLNQPITIANNATDANNDIDFTAGNFQFNDNSGGAFTSAMTKRLDASWSAGTNQGGLDTGTKQANTWYHCYVIHNLTTQVSDFIFSVNATSPTLPSGFTKYKYLGSVLTNVSNNIILFKQNKNQFKWNDPIEENFDANITTSNKTLTLTVPPVLLKPNVSCYWQGGKVGSRVERLDFTSNLTGTYYMHALTFGDGTGFPHYFDTVINKMIINDKNILYKATVGGAGGTGFCYTNGYHNLSL